MTGSRRRFIADWLSRFLVDSLVSSSEDSGEFGVRRLLGGWTGAETSVAFRFKSCDDCGCFGFNWYDQIEVEVRLRDEIGDGPFGGGGNVPQEKVAV